MLDDEGPLTDTPQPAFPWLGDMDTLAQRTSNRGHKIAIEAASPNAIAICKADEEEPCRTIIVEKNAGVDAFLVTQQRLHHPSALLSERA